jgi:hypothetical protein
MAEGCQPVKTRRRPPRPVSADGLDFGETMVEGVAAAGAEFVGAFETRDAIDVARSEARADFWQNVDDAGNNLSEAYTDVVGE